MDPVVVRLLGVLTFLLLVVLAGRLLQRRDGRIRVIVDDALHTRHLDAVGLDLGDARAGAVLIGSATCSPCDSVKELLGELEAERAGFRWVYADAADHLELAEAHRVMRVPTLFMVEPSGRILARTSGVPRADDLRRVLDNRGEKSESVA